MKLTKHEMAVTILQALLGVDVHKARHLATINHSEYASLMKNKKSHLEYMHETAVRVLTNIKRMGV